jgi:CheY-like chemotaxis protein
MPIKNGYETCREIRAWEAKNHFHQIPIMALSANAMTDQIDIAAQSGFNDYVTKPIKHNELGKMMMTLLDPNTPQILLRDRKDWQQQNP